MSETIEIVQPAPEPAPPEPPHRLVNGVKVLLTEAEIAARAAEEAAQPARVTRWEVPKLRIVERLRDAGVLRAAYMGLKLEASIADLTDAELAMRERWNAADAIKSDDADALALLRAIGADPAVILARP